MTKLEYSDLYKFLASLGVVLIGLALLVPWLFLRESFDALLKTSDISELTPTAQMLLSYRQQAALWFIKSVWWISPLLALGGLLLLIMGIVPWRKRQQHLVDQREKFEMQKAGWEVERLKREIEPMTYAQIAIKGIEEVEEEIEVAEEAPEASVIPSIKSHLQEYFRVEEIFLNKLIACYGEERVLTQKRIEYQAYDAILLSDRPQLTDVVFEVKRLTRHFSLSRLRAAIEQVILLIQGYAILAGRETTTIIGIVFFVLPEGDRDSARMDEFVWEIKDQADLHGVRIHPIFITEEELIEIRCSELRAKINKVATAM
jgi:hypothetical protein